MNLLKTAFSAVTGFFTGGAGITTYIMVGMGVLLAAAVGIVAWEESRVSDRDTALGTLAETAKQSAQTAKDNEAEVKRVTAKNATDMAEIQKQLAAARLTQRQINDIKETIRARPEDKQPAGCPDVPGPILRAIGGVQQLRDAGVPDQGPGGARPSPGPTARVRGVPAPAK